MHRGRVALHSVPVDDMVQTVFVVDPVVEGERVGLAVSAAQDLDLNNNKAMWWSRRGIKGRQTDRLHSVVSRVYCLSPLRTPEPDARPPPDPFRSCGCGCDRAAQCRGP